jgi:rhodanese-related sulfurtransferase
MSVTPLPSIEVTEAARRLQDATDPSRPLVVDVREPHELVVERVAGSVFLPISRFVDGVRSLPTDRSLLMLCRSGSRSASATEYLLRNGFGDVHNVRGGILAWKAAGLPTTSGPIQPGEGEVPRTGGPRGPGGG